MPTQKQQTSQNREQEQVAQRRHELAPETRIDYKHDQMRDLTALLTTIANRQEQMQNRHTNEWQALAAMQQLNQRAVESVYSQPVQRVTQQAAEQRATEQQVTLAALEQFAAAQQTQVEQRQQVENQLLQGQAAAVEELRTRQQAALNDFAQQTPTVGRNAEQSQNQARRDLETRQRQEQELLQMRIDAENQVVRSYQNRSNIEAERDLETLQQALYATKLQENRAEVLQNILDQQAARQQLLADSYQQALTQVAQEYDKHKAQYGEVAVYGDQTSKRAIRDQENRRLSEKEHITAWINYALMTMSEAGKSFLRESAKDKQAYLDMVTLTIAREMALTKTAFDMAVKRTQEAAKEQTMLTTNQLAALRDLLQMEADVERTMRAREITIEQRLQAGKTIADLLLSTDEKILQAAVLQRSVVEELGRQEAALFLQSVTDEEIEAIFAAIAPYLTEETDTL